MRSGTKEVIYYTDKLHDMILFNVIFIDRGWGLNYSKLLEWPLQRLQLIFGRCLIFVMGMHFFR